MKYALVGGWGAVEKEAERWAADAVIVEVEPRLWEVRLPDGTPLGAIGKEPCSIGKIQRHAESMAATQESV